jgi:Ca-activated chloride channel family protein
MTRAFLSFVWIFIASSIYGQSDTCQNRPEDRFRVLFLLDASHSMGQKWDNKPLWEIAKKTIEEFSFFLQKNYNVEMGLRVYGHNSPVSANDCFDSKLEVPIEENSAKKIVAKLRTIEYKGTTPLTYSLEQAAEDLGCNSKKNVIILITDGYETCNRNPCAMAEKLLDFRISIKPLIIGLNIDPKEIQHLHCIGDFKNARNKEDFKKELYNSFINIANRRSFSVFLKNGDKKTSETNIPFTLYNAKNGEFIAVYYHHLSQSQMPDTIATGNYDSVNIKIHCVPPLWIKNIKLKKYVHNTLEVNYPKGILDVKWDNTSGKIYENPLGFIYQDTNLLDKFYLPASVDMLEGDYKLALNTIPSRSYANLSIKRGKSNEIILPAPGLLNITYSSDIYGDLYVYRNNILEKCMMLSTNKSIESISLLPGKYKIIYRSQKSMTIHATFEKAFDVTSFSITNVSL